MKVMKLLSKVMLYMAIIMINLSGVVITLWSYAIDDYTVLAGGLALITISMILIDNDIESREEAENEKEETPCGEHEGTNAYFK